MKDIQVKQVIERQEKKIKCSIPFSLNYFFHKNVVSVKYLSDNVQLIKCLDCDKMFAINHDVRLILPWEDIKYFYDKNNNSL